MIKLTQHEQVYSSFLQPCKPDSLQKHLPQTQPTCSTAQARSRLQERINGWWWRADTEKPSREKAEAELGYGGTAPSWSGLLSGPSARHGTKQTGESWVSIRSDWLDHREEGLQLLPSQLLSSPSAGQCANFSRRSWWMWPPGFHFNHIFTNWTPLGIKLKMLSHTGKR